MPERKTAATKRRNRWPPVSEFFRNRAGTLALVLAVTLALWALILAVASMVWG